MVKDVGRLGHLDHEGGLARRQVIARPDPGKDAIGDPQPRRVSRDPAADLSHQLQEPGLAQIAALAAGVGPREHHQVTALAEAHVIGGEGFVHQQLLHHGVASPLDLEAATASNQFRFAVSAGGRHLRQ